MLRCTALAVVVLCLYLVPAGSVNTPNGPVPFDVVDTNKDGVIDRDEYTAYMSQDLGTIGSGSKKSQTAPRAASEDDADAVLRAQLAAIQEPVLGFWGAFLNSVAMIIVTELGDKTFFIAAILAMQYDRLFVFIGAIGALATMTVLSSAIGFALPNLLPRMYTHYLASVLFAYFGFRLLKDAYDMDTTQPNEELAEVEEELGAGTAKRTDEEAGEADEAVISPAKWKILWQSFTLTFLAEWGDRSQIATIALASAKDPIGVTIGGVLGHAMCTGLAVIGGRLLATKISERTVAIAGGLLFIVFAIHSVYAGPDV